MSNLYGYKRMDLVIRAYARADGLREDHDLVIAGAEVVAGSIARLRAEIRHAGLRDEQVRLLGFVDRDILTTLYENASVYVSASEREAFPLTPAEALVAGLPVVLSDIPPFRELYGDWATLVPTGDVEALASGIRAALDRGPVPRHAAEVRQRFSWERNARALARLVAEVAKEGRPSLRTSLRRIRVRSLGRFALTVVGGRLSGASAHDLVAMQVRTLRVGRGRRRGDSA